jgi:SpoVK/Ycf46/Vps4 family AAA+-type ATPase
MLIGSMGSGKTQLGFSILCEAKLRYEISPFYVTSSQLLKDAEEVLDKLFKSAIESEPSFIFIDDIHELCTKENRKQSSALNLLTAQLDKA